MKSRIFSIIDLKADAYLQPFFMPTDKLAIRTFQDCVNDPKHNFGQHPEDYILFNIGIFDQVKGTITPEAQPKTLVSGIDCKRQIEKENNT